MVLTTTLLAATNGLLDLDESTRGSAAGPCQSAALLGEDNPQLEEDYPIFVAGSLHPTEATRGFQL